MGKFLAFLLIIVLVFLTVECDKGMPVDQGVLVSTDWLQNHLNDPDLIILHAGTEEGYDSIHIPGARLISPWDFTVSNDSVRNELPTMDSVVNLLKNAGVDTDSRIILCYERQGLIPRTARIFVTLVHAGLAERTLVLNGGLPAWLEEERETTDVATDKPLGNLEAQAPVEVTISTSDLERLRWSPEVVVIDARPDEEYHGTPATEEEEAEGGHVEGAYKLPYYSSFLGDSSYLFKTDAELEKLFRDSGMDPNKTTIVYCGSGIWASVPYLTAIHLGYPVLLYDESYQEWERLDLPLTGPVDPPVENE
jgi:thiosulfate/3-mercaptopyruvate sulfurtransferase